MTEPVRDPEAQERSNEAKKYRLRLRETEDKLAAEQAAWLVQKSELEARIRKLESSHAPPGEAQPAVTEGGATPSGSEKAGAPTTPAAASDGSGGEGSNATGAPSAATAGLQGDEAYAALEAVRTARHREILGSRIAPHTLIPVTDAIAILEARGVKTKVLKGEPYIVTEVATEQGSVLQDVPLTREALTGILPPSILRSREAGGSGTNAPEPAASNALDMGRALSDQNYFEANYSQIMAARAKGGF